MRGARLALVAALTAAASAPLVASGADAPALVPPPPRTFANACASCHDGGGFGVVVLRDRVGADRAVLRRRTDLTAGLIRVAVRNGIGAMPAMSKLEVSDVELDGIIAELTRAGQQ